jgi:phage terminase small subunit
MSRRELTDKQRLFVAEYLVDLNATAAYKRAGYSARGNSAEVSASRLLRNAQVQAALSRAVQTLIDRAEVSAERVLEEYRRVGLSDMRQFLSWGPDGVTWKDSDELDEAAAACVAEVSETISEGGRTRRFKLHSKMHALDQLSKYVKLLGEERPPAGTTVNVNLGTKSDEDRAREVLALHEQIAAYRKGYDDAERDSSTGDLAEAEEDAAGAYGGDA